jgi:iron complex transport system permease protein
MSGARSLRHLTLARVLLVCGVLLVVLAASMLVSLVFGTEGIDLFAAWQSGEGTAAGDILFVARLPRLALAAIAGAALAATGVAFQALLRNPLADPYVLGVSAGAALGGTVAVAAGLGATALGAAALPLASFVGAAASVTLLYALARASNRVSTQTLLLTGVVFNAFSGAVILFVKTVVSPQKAQELLFWMVGRLDYPTGRTLVTLGVYVAIGLVVLLLDSARMNTLALGEEGAEALGVSAEAVKKRILIASSLIVGAVVSVTGPIGFVGLIVPHAVRLALGPDHRLLLPASALAGAAFLALSDLVARLLFNVFSADSPVGVVTAILGGPLFLFLLRRSLKQGAL